MDDKILHSISLKNTLILCETEDIICYINSSKRYLDFLYKVYSIIKIDPHFFLLKDYIEVVQKVISNFRFNKEISLSDFKENENKIIGILNEIKEERKDKKIKDDYLYNQSKLRGGFFTEEDKILISIAYDKTFVFDTKNVYLSCGIMSQNIISSINYLLNVHPSVFTTNEDTLLMTHFILGELKKDKKVKSDAIKLIKRINKL